MEKIVNFPIGAVFLIRNLQTNQALQVENKQNPKNSKIILSEPNPQNIHQLWMVQQIHAHQFQIIHAQSCLIMEAVQGQIYLKPGQQKPTQFWNVKKYDDGTGHHYLRILRQNDKKAIYSSSNIKYKTAQQNEVIFNWKFAYVNNNKLLNMSCIISSCNSGKVIDVPRASNQKGTNLIQYTRNGRFNQRWLIISKGQSCIIKNLKSRLNLDIKGQGTSEGTNIIQWTGQDNFVSKPNQLWRLQRNNQKEYIIRSLLEKSMILGVQKNSLNDEAKLVILKSSTNYSWIIDGFVQEECIVQI